MAASASECSDVYADENAPRGARCGGAGPASEFFQQQADALVEVAQSYLAGVNNGKDSKDSKTGSADRYQVMVHIDEKALSGHPDADSRSDLPLETVRRLCCDGSMVPVVEDANHNPVGCEFLIRRLLECR